MQPALYDSSIYIAGLGHGDLSALATRWLAPEVPLWLSAVVLEELYAGADRRERRVIEQLERDLERVKRILVPNLADWAETGKALARLAAEYDYELIGRSRLTNDALIAFSAGRRGIRVLTANRRDFQRLSEFRPFQWQVIAI